MQSEVLDFVEGMCGEEAILTQYDLTLYAEAEGMQLGGVFTDLTANQLLLGKRFDLLDMF